MQCIRSFVADVASTIIYVYIMSNVYSVFVLVFFVCLHHRLASVCSPDFIPIFVCTYLYRYNAVKVSYRIIQVLLSSLSFSLIFFVSLLNLSFPFNLSHLSFFSISLSVLLLLFFRFFVLACLCVGRQISASSKCRTMQYHTGTLQTVVRKATWC